MQSNMVLALKTMNYRKQFPTTQMPHVGDVFSAHIPDKVFGLVVDDCEIHRELVSGVFKQHNIKTSSAYTWKQLEDIQYIYCCIIVLDLGMPDLSGIEVLHLLAQKNIDVPIIIFSGADPCMLEAATKLGEKLGLKMVATMQKPFQFDVLSNFIQRYSLERNAIKLKVAQEYLKLASLVFLHSSESMAVTDANGSILTVNPAFSRLTGYSLEEVVGKNPKILSSGLHDATFYKNMWQSININGCWRGEIWNRRKTGEVYVEYLSISTAFDDVGDVQFRVAQFYDITHEKKSEILLWKHANVDFLTGLPNRCMFHNHLQQEIEKCRSSGLSLALMLLDMDRFKVINNRHGHQHGDILLQHVAQRLLSCVRSVDTVTRLDGDEFAIILSELDNRRCVESIAQEICAKLAEPFFLGDKTAEISVSIGIAFDAEDAPADMETLIGNAEQAMYSAKQQGRNRYCYFSPAQQKAAQRRLELIEELKVALQENQFEVYYQPIVALADGSVHKAEALIRWHHPDQGILCPAKFIPVAEETGLILSVDNWVFQEAVNHLRELRLAHGVDFQLSINVSPVQFSACSTWSRYLQEQGCFGNSIVLDITEGLLMNSSTAVIDQLDLFRSIGVQLAIDDFGSGYSSLAYIKKLAVDYIKIDQAFICGLAPDSNDAALCEAVVVMAHKLGIKVIAEGVETQEQYSLLCAMGCDFAQGYFFTQPLPTSGFSQWLFQHSQSSK